MFQFKRIAKRLVIAIVVAGVLPTASPQPVWGDDPASRAAVRPVEPIKAEVPVKAEAPVKRADSAKPAEPVKRPTQMEGTLPPPRATRGKPAQPSLPSVKPAAAPSRQSNAPQAERPRLGLNVNAEQAVINTVYPDSGAAAAGVRPGGRIVAIDGQPVRNVEDLKRVLRDRTSLDTVILQVDYRASAASRVGQPRTPSIKTFRVPLGKPKVIYLELPAPAKEK
ncbi:PDZ domain-containing protein [Novipirellula caenicola]